MSRRTPSDDSASLRNREPLRHAPFRLRRAADSADEVIEPNDDVVVDIALPADEVIEPNNVVVDITSKKSHIFLPERSYSRASWELIKYYWFPCLIMCAGAALVTLSETTFSTKNLNNPVPPPPPPPPGSQSSSSSSGSSGGGLYEFFQNLISDFQKINAFANSVSAGVWAGLTVLLALPFFLRSYVNSFDKRASFENFDLLYLLGKQWDFERHAEVRQNNAAYGRRLKNLANKKSSEKLVGYFQKEIEEIAAFRLVESTSWSIARKLLGAVLGMYTSAIGETEIEEHHQETINSLFVHFREALVQAYWIDGDPLFLAKKNFEKKKGTRCTPTVQNVDVHLFEKILESQEVNNLNIFLLRAGFLGFFDQKIAHKKSKLIALRIFEKFEKNLTRAKILLAMLTSGGFTFPAIEIAQKLFWESGLSISKQKAVITLLVTNETALQIGDWGADRPDQEDRRLALSRLFDLSNPNILRCIPRFIKSYSENAGNLLRLLKLVGLDEFGHWKPEAIRLFWNDEAFTTVQRKAFFVEWVREIGTLRPADEQKRQKKLLCDLFLAAQCEGPIAPLERRDSSDAWSVAGATNPEDDWRTQGSVADTNETDSVTSENEVFMLERSRGDSSATHGSGGGGGGAAGAHEEKEVPQGLGFRRELPPTPPSNSHDDRASPQSVASAEPMSAAPERQPVDGIQNLDTKRHEVLRELTRERLHRAHVAAPDQFFSFVSAALSGLADGEDRAVVMRVITDWWRQYAQNEKKKFVIKWLADLSRQEAAPAVARDVAIQIVEDWDPSASAAQRRRNRVARAEERRVISADDAGAPLAAGYVELVESDDEASTVDAAAVPVIAPPEHAEHAVILRELFMLDRVENRSQLLHDLIHVGRRQRNTPERAVQLMDRLHEGTHNPVRADLNERFRAALWNVDRGDNDTDRNPLTAQEIADFFVAWRRSVAEGFDNVELNRDVFEIFLGRDILHAKRLEVCTLLQTQNPQVLENILIRCVLAATEPDRVAIVVVVARWVSIDTLKSIFNRFKLEADRLIHAELPAGIPLIETILLLESNATKLYQFPYQVFFGLGTPQLRIAALSDVTFTDTLLAVLFQQNLMEHAELTSFYRDFFDAGLSLPDSGNSARSRREIIFLAIKAIADHASFVEKDRIYTILFHLFYGFQGPVIGFGTTGTTQQADLLSRLGPDLLEVLDHALQNHPETIPEAALEFPLGEVLQLPFRSFDVNKKIGALVHIYIAATRAATDEHKIQRFWKTGDFLLHNMDLENRVDLFNRAVANGQVNILVAIWVASTREDDYFQDTFFVDGIQPQTRIEILRTLIGWYGRATQPEKQKIFPLCWKVEDCSSEIIHKKAQLLAESTLNVHPFGTTLIEILFHPYRVGREAARVAGAAAAGAAAAGADLRIPSAAEIYDIAAPLFFHEAMNAARGKLFVDLKTIADGRENFANLGSQKKAQINAFLRTLFTSSPQHGAQLLLDIPQESVGLLIDVLKSSMLQELNNNVLTAFRAMRLAPDDAQPFLTDEQKVHIFNKLKAYADLLPAPAPASTPAPAEPGKKAEMYQILAAMYATSPVATKQTLLVKTGVNVVEVWLTVSREDHAAVVEQINAAQLTTPLLVDLFRALKTTADNQDITSRFCNHINIEKKKYIYIFLLQLFLTRQLKNPEVDLLASSPPAYVGPSQKDLLNTLGAEFILVWIDHEIFSSREAGGAAAGVAAATSRFDLQNNLPKIFNELDTAKQQEIFRNLLTAAGEATPVRKQKIYEVLRNLFMKAKDTEKPYLLDMLTTGKFIEILYPQELAANDSEIAKSRDALRIALEKQTMETTRDEYVGALFEAAARGASEPLASASVAGAQPAIGARRPSPPLRAASVDHHAVEMGGGSGGGGADESKADIHTPLLAGGKAPRVYDALRTAGTFAPKPGGAAAPAPAVSTANPVQLPRHISGNALATEICKIFFPADATVIALQDELQTIFDGAGTGVAATQKAVLCLDVLLTGALNAGEVRQAFNAFLNQYATRNQAHFVALLAAYLMTDPSIVSHRSEKIFQAFFGAHGEALPWVQIFNTIAVTSNEGASAIGILLKQWVKTPDRHGTLKALMDKILLSNTIRESLLFDGELPKNPKVVNDILMSDTNATAVRAKFLTTLDQSTQETFAKILIATATRERFVEILQGDAPADNIAQINEALRRMEISGVLTGIQKAEFIRFCDEQGLTLTPPEFVAINMSLDGDQITLNPLAVSK